MVATVEEGPDYIIITPPEKLNVMAIDTFDGHRMAMAYSLGACAELPVNIKGRHVHSRSWDLPQQLRRAKHLHQELDQNAI